MFRGIRRAQSTTNPVRGGNRARIPEGPASGEWFICAAPKVARAADNGACGLRVKPPLQITHTAAPDLTIVASPLQPPQNPVATPFPRAPKNGAFR